MMSDGLQWFAVHTHPQGEMTALRNLVRQGFEVYLPRYLKQWRHARRVEKRAVPLFPRYLFVQLNVAEMRWRAIASTIGVSGLICRGEVPAPVRDDIIQEIRDRENADGMIHVNDISFRKGDPLQVTSGPLLNAIGIFDGVSDRDRVLLLLNLLGRKIRVAVPTDFVAVPA
jgi:transcriptional antiterminator RfaH